MLYFETSNTCYMYLFGTNLLLQKNGFVLTRCHPIDVRDDIAVLSNYYEYKRLDLHKFYSSEQLAVVLERCC
jgi:hypothetical protein